MDVVGLSDGDLCEQVRTWSARIARGDAVLQDLIGELDGREAWAGDGVRSCAHWLSWQLGWSPSTSRERVRVARALRDLPRIRQALHDGRLTYSQVRAVTRVATAVEEEQWLALARVSTGEQLDKVARGAARARAAGRPAAERAAKRAVLVDWDDDGDLVLTVRVPAHEAVPVLAVLEQYQAAEQTERDEQVQAFLATALDPPLGGASAEAPDQLPLLHLAADGTVTAPAAPAAPAGPAEPAVVLHAAPADAPDAVLCLADSAEAPDAVLCLADSAGAPAIEPGIEPGIEVVDLAAEDAKGYDPLRPYPYVEPDYPYNPDQVTVYRPAAEQRAQDQWRITRDRARAVRDAWDARRQRLLTAASAQRIPTGRATLADGLVRALTRPVDGPKTTVRLLLDPLSGWARTQHDELLPPATLDELIRTLPTSRAPMNRPVALTAHDRGRTDRTVPPGLRRLLGQLDGERCRFPGCTHTRFLHAHHVRFWRDGGPTDLANTILLCTRHHQLLHAEGHLLTLDPQTRAVTVTRPDGIPLEAHPQLPAASAEALPAAQPADPGYGGERFDLDHAVWVMLQHAA